LIEKEIVQFIRETVKQLSDRERKLRYPSKRKAHGRLRPTREVRDIRRSRSPSVYQLREAIKVLRGKDPNKSIIFLEDEDGKIVGFNIFNGRKRHRG
jgi:hypothetical protein